MAYLTINGVDFSHLVNELRVTRAHNYNSQTNAAGDTVVDYINVKRTIEAGFISMPETEAKALLTVLDAFSVTLGYRDPKSGVLETGVACIVPEVEADYYTIQSSGLVMLNGFTVEFTEL